MQESSPGSQSQEEPLQPTQANPKNPEDEAAPKKKKKENEKSPTTTPVQLLTSTLRLPAGSKELADKTAASTENAALPEQSANGEQRTQTSEGGNDKSSHAKDKDAATQEQPTRFKQKKRNNRKPQGAINQEESISSEEDDHKAEKDYRSISSSDVSVRAWLVQPPYR